MKDNCSKNQATFHILNVGGNLTKLPTNVEENKNLAVIQN